MKILERRYGVSLNTAVRPSSDNNHGQIEEGRQHHLCGCLAHRGAKPSFSALSIREKTVRALANLKREQSFYGILSTLRNRTSCGVCCLWHVLFSGSDLCIQNLPTTCTI